MNLPEPTAWHYTRDTDSAISFAPDRDPEKPWQRLYSEGQVREMLAQQEAVMRQALDALIKETVISYSAINDGYVRDCAIKALEEALK